MFLRSTDGKHLKEVKTIDLDGTKLMVNGELFETFANEDDAMGAVRAISREICLTDSFYDLSGEITDEDDFDDDDYEDEDEDFEEDDGDEGDDGEEGSGSSFTFLL